MGTLKGKFESLQRLSCALTDLKQILSWVQCSDDQNNCVLQQVITVPRTGCYIDFFLFISRDISIDNHMLSYHRTAPKQSVISAVQRSLILRSKKQRYVNKDAFLLQCLFVSHNETRGISVGSEITSLLSQEVTLHINQNELFFGGECAIFQHLRYKPQFLFSCCKNNHSHLHL